MIVEAITVCVGFADYLAETLPLNKSQFSRRIIVTSEDDTDTQKLAREYDCKLVITSAHLYKGPFNKGRAINTGLNHVLLGHWICHIDADIVLPPGCHTRLAGYLEPLGIPSRRSDSIIGMARYMVTGKDQWEQFRQDWDERKLALEPPRLDNKHIPVGFYQLWHTSANKRYPDNIPAANSSDLEFGKQFKYKRQVPERCYHLAATNAPKGSDWLGRKTPLWG